MLFLLTCTYVLLTPAQFYDQDHEGQISRENFALLHVELLTHGYSNIDADVEECLVQLRARTGAAGAKWRKASGIFHGVEAQKERPHQDRSAVCELKH